MQGAGVASTSEIEKYSMHNVFTCTEEKEEHKDNKEQQEYISARNATSTKKILDDRIDYGLKNVLRCSKMTNCTAHVTLDTNMHGLFFFKKKK